MASILIVDDEHVFRGAVEKVLRSAGHEVLGCASADEALPVLRERNFDVVISDLRMPGRSGLDLLFEAAKRLPDCILIVLTAYGSIESAIEALRIGVHDFLLKPANLEMLVRKVDFLVRHQATLAENRFLRKALEIDTPPTGLVGSSRGIEEVRRLISKVAPTDSTVLVLGETGTGKELVARAVHQASSRRGQPFVAVNCGSIPETLLESELFGHLRGAFTGAERDKRGLFEVAGGGTLLLDEIGDMPLALQPKILRALEAREILRIGSTVPVRISARVIAATHRDLEAMVRAGSFRADLYFRLNVFSLFLPPLRGRPEDVHPLAMHLLERLAARMNRLIPALSPEALRALEGYAWPGNVRELANVLERALILAEGPRIDQADLPGVLSRSDAPGQDDLKLARDAFERMHIHRVLLKHGGDKRKAAEALGINLSSLYRKLDEEPLTDAGK